jgi:MFS family permease
MNFTATLTAHSHLTCLCKSEILVAYMLAKTFSALKYKEYRAYFIGHMVSVCGTWTQNIALACLVYKLTQSPFLLGLVEFANLFPLLALSFISGILADRFDRKVIVITALAFAAVQAATLCAASITGHMSITLIVICSFVNGITNAFEIPARSAMLPHMVHKKDLSNAISLSAALASTGRIVGAVIAAFAVKCGAESLCFGLNALSFTALIMAMFVQKPCRPQRKSKEGTFTEYRSFLRLVAQEPVLSRALCLCAMTSLFGVQFYMLLPVVAHDRFAGNTGLTGLLFGLVSTGALMAALLLAKLNNPVRAGLAVCASTVAVGICLLIAAVCAHPAVNIVLLPALGFCFMLQNTSIQSVVQSHIADEMRGKVMSAWATLSIGIIPLGNLMIGCLTNHAGLSVSLFICGAMTLASGLLYVVLDRHHRRTLVSA